MAAKKWFTVGSDWVDHIFEHPRLNPPPGRQHSRHRDELRNP